LKKKIEDDEIEKKRRVSGFNMLEKIVTVISTRGLLRLPLLFLFSYTRICFSATLNPK